MPDRDDVPSDRPFPGPVPRPIPRRLLPFLDGEGPLHITVFVAGCVIVGLVLVYYAISLKWISLG
ncbi:MAG: hypothetical protein HZA54_02120 [Planctomycetes bacterium]|nr:hypothetical protein [Planctomycetota bacterium]